jgi:DtxR family Mn-dependent transcriptional regulator
MLTIAFFGLIFFWLGTALFSRWGRKREFMTRVLSEDALKHIHKTQVSGRRPTLQSIAGTLHIHSDRAAGLLADMEKRNLVTLASGDLQLTPAGREAALHIIRAHRLWETYLADQTGIAESEWHGQAENQEHHLGPEQLNELSAQLGHPTHDPHGDVIPVAKGALPADRGQSLNTVAAGEAALITVYI